MSSVYAPFPVYNSITIKIYTVFRRKTEYKKGTKSTKISSYTHISRAFVLKDGIYKDIKRIDLISSFILLNS